MTSNNTQLDLDAIEARLTAATKGPWGSHRDLNGAYTVQARPRSTRYGMETDGDIATLAAGRSDAESYANARFIAHAPADVDALADEVRRLRAAEPAEITVTELAHALDNSTPYPIELDRQLCDVMAARLLEMLTVGKRAEHPVWQPEDEPEPGVQPQPEDPAAAAVPRRGDAETTSEARCTCADAGASFAPAGHYGDCPAAVEVVHGCPPDGSGLTPCCGRTPFELPRTDRISSEAPVTCPGPEQPAAGAQQPKEAVWCSAVALRVHHSGHDWEPQPGMDSVHCGGYPQPKETRP